MKISIRHEPATEANEPEGSEATPDRACVWVADDIGQTTSTVYLDDGQSVEIDTEGAVTVGEIQDQPEAPETGPEGSTGSEGEPGGSAE